MQENLWGEEIVDLQRMPKPTPGTMFYTPVHCACYGHTWVYSQISGEKICSICNVKGYCPGCSTQTSKDAQPFFCTKHTPTESEARA